MGKYSSGLFKPHRMGIGKGRSAPVSMGRPTTPDPALKGKYNGNCNREACQGPGATWVNLWRPNEFYCRGCARMIEEANRAEGYEAFKVARAVFNGATMDDGAIVGVERNGSLIQWNAETHRVYTGSETLVEFGTANLTNDEFARLHPAYLLEVAKNALQRRDGL